MRTDTPFQDNLIILLTGLEDAGAATLGKKPGATTTPCKPFGPEYLVEFLNTQLGCRDGPPWL